MRGPTARAAAIVLSALALAGCGGRELQDRAFVVAAAVDLTARGVALSLFTPGRPNGGTEEGSPVLERIAENGTTFAGAWRVLQAGRSRQLYLGTCRLLLLGEEYARRRSVTALLRRFLRAGVSRSVSVAVVRGRATTVWSSSSRGDPVADLQGLLSDPAGQGWLPRTDLGRYLVDEDEPGLDPVLPLLTGGKRARAEGTGFFRRGVLTGTADPAETLFMNLLGGRLSAGILPERDGPAVRLTGKSFRLSRQGNRLICRVTAIIEPREAEQRVEDAGRRLLRKLARAGVDPLGFGRLYYRRHPDNGASLLRGEYRIRGYMP
ncbi:MAG: hypothetical protein ACM3XS_00660, partial [Bacteroidota bacterium]